MGLSVVLLAVELSMVLLAVELSRVLLAVELSVVLLPVELSMVLKYRLSTLLVWSQHCALLHNVIRRKL